MARIEHELFGNGQPGIAHGISDAIQETVQELRSLRENDMETVRKLHYQNIERMNSIEENQWKIQTRLTVIISVGVTVLSIMEFLTGGGFATLHTVIEHWPK